MHGCISDFGRGSCGLMVKAVDSDHDELGSVSDDAVNGFPLKLFQCST